MKALVTGCAGFLGRHFVHELRYRGWEVVGVDVRPMIFPSCLDWDIPASYERPADMPDPHYGTFAYHQGDAMDVFRWQADTLKMFDLVVHAAAVAPHRMGIDKQPGSHIVNRMLDASLFEWALRTGQRRVLYFSSCAVFDMYHDDYALVKLAGEGMAGLARRAGLKVTVVRPFSGYGSDQDICFPFGAFISRAAGKEDPFVVWGDGTQLRDWIHVDDIVRASLAIAEDGTEDPISLGWGRATSMGAVANMVVQAAGYMPRMQFRLDMPAGASRRVADPGPMLKYYQPTVTLQDGIARALADYTGGPATRAHPEWSMGHPEWCAHRHPHPGKQCSVIHRRDCECKPPQEREPVPAFFP